MIFLIISTLVVSILVVALLKPLAPLILLKLKLKEEAALRFFPFIGFLFYDFYSQYRYRDPLKWVEILLSKQPNVKYILTNFQLQPYIIFGGLDGVHQLLADSWAPRFNCFPIQGFMERGLNFVGGNDWKNQRKLLAKSFTYEELAKRTQIIQTITKNTLSKVKEDEPLDAMEFGATITSQTIIQTFFGGQLSSFEGEDAGQAIRKVVNNLIRIFERPYFVLKYLFFGYKAWDIFPSIYEKDLITNFRLLRKVANQIINERFEQKQNNLMKHKDFLDDYMKQENNIDQTKIEEIIQNFFTFFVAGTDTTAHLIMYSLYYLGLYPEIQELLKQEVQNLKQEYTINDLRELTYMQAFINEVIRTELALNSFTPRIAYQQLEFDNLVIKKNWLFGFSAKLIHSNEKYYKNAKVFNIERWINNKEVAQQSFLGFSQGSRNCIGQNLGQIEAKVVLVELLRKWKVILLNKQLDKQLGTMIGVRNSSFVKLMCN